VELRLSFPTCSIAITSKVRGKDQGSAGALFTTGQQTGAAVGLAILATAAATRTAHASGSLVAGYKLSFLIATALPCWQPDSWHFSSVSSPANRN
jgi:hypothetical protein